jgi:hypothetical protein
VIDISDENSAGHLLFLEMTLQTECVVSLVQHSLIDRAMGRVADETAFAHCFMLKHEWTALRGVTLHTGVVRAQEGDPATDKRLLQTGTAAFNRFASVRVVAVGTAHLAFQDRMMVGQLKLSAQVLVTLKTRFGRFPWIDDFALIAAGRNVQASRTVT